MVNVPFTLDGTGCRLIDSMRRINAISFLNNFISGALTLLIPLLLLDKNVDLAAIGLVLSVLPLVFLVTRLFLAAIADRIGWSYIFLLVNWPANVFSTLIYYAASSLPVFLVGKVVEGLRDSSYWAVTRTAIFHLSPNREGREATRNTAVIWLATAIGSAAAGIGIAYLGFSPTLLFLMMTSLTIGLPAALLWKVGKSRRQKDRGIRGMLSPRGKGRAYWFVSVALMFNSLATYPLVTLLLPAFMSQEMGYSYVLIGVLFMLYNLIASVTTFLTLKRPLTVKRAVLQSTIAMAASTSLAFAGMFFPAVFFALAFVRGFSAAFFEHSVAKIASGSRNVSVDIGWLHVPMRLAEFSSVLTAGFVAQALGYAPVFAASGIFFAVFSFMSLRALRF